MQKQILYPNFTIRLISASIDMMAIYIISSLYKKICSQYDMINILIIITMFLYFSLFPYYTGYTIGKYIMRICIVKINDYSKPSLMQNIIRTIMYPIGLFSMPFMQFTKNKRALHDRISNTIVIYK